MDKNLTCLSIGVHFYISLGKVCKTSSYQNAFAIRNKSLIKNLFAQLKIAWNILVGQGIEK